jgi:hypothetical protein
MHRLLSFLAWTVAVTLVTACSYGFAQEPASPEPPAAKAKAVEKLPAEVPDESPTEDAKPTDAKPADDKPAEAKPEDAKPEDAKPGAVKPAVAKPPAAKPPVIKSPYRKLAPGVLQTVDPMRALGESVSRHDVVALLPADSKLAADPKYDWVKGVPFHQDVWVLDFKFKPVRMIWVDVPQPSGMMQRKLIWYMVYSVTNSGKVMHPVEDVPLDYETFDKKMLYQVKMEDRPVRYLPEFLLEGHQRMEDGKGFVKYYPDRVIPVALDPIRQREDPNRKFLTTVDMCRELAVGETQWGVATWEDVDPRIVRFSVYAFGLTNAYKWKDDPKEVKPGDPVGKGRKLYRKLLKLNFWRPSDPYYEHEEEIRYGIPGGVDYEWVYR